MFVSLNVGGNIRNCSYLFKDSFTHRKLDYSWVIKAIFYFEDDFQAKITIILIYLFNIDVVRFYGDETLSRSKIIRE